MKDTVDTCRHMQTLRFDRYDFYRRGVPSDDSCGFQNMSQIMGRKMLKFGQESQGLDRMRRWQPKLLCTKQCGESFFCPFSVFPCLLSSLRCFYFCCFPSNLLVFLRYLSVSMISWETVFSWFALKAQNFNVFFVRNRICMDFPWISGSRTSAVARRGRTNGPAPPRLGTARNSPFRQKRGKKTRFVKIYRPQIAWKGISHFRGFLLVHNIHFSTFINRNINIIRLKNRNKNTDEEFHGYTHFR